MNVLVISSKTDPAGTNIHDSLLKHFEFKEEGTFDENSKHVYQKGSTVHLVQAEELFFRNLPKYQPMLEKTFPDLDLIVNAVWHSGESGPLLSTHVMGNPTNTDKGAPARSFAIAAPIPMKNALQTYQQKKDELGLNEFEVCQEITHGPPTTFQVPIMDLEIGSTNKEYTNDKAGEAAAHAVMSVLKPQEAKIAIGFGGLHYAEKFTKPMLEGKLAVGHIFPSYALPDFDKELLEKAIARTWGKVEYLILDKKEKGEYKVLARRFAEELGLQVINHNQAVGFEA